MDLNRLKQEIKEELKREFKQDLKEELKSEIKQDLKEEIRAEMFDLLPHTSSVKGQTIDSMNAGTCMSPKFSS